MTSERLELKVPDLCCAEEAQQIEAALTRLPGPSPHILPPKALNNRLAALTGEVQQADGRPTRQMYGVFEGLSGLIADRLRQLDEVIQKDVRPLTNMGGDEQR